MNEHWKKIAIGGGVLALIWAAVSSRLPEAAEERSDDVANARFFADFDCDGCSVLLITLETLRADHLECLGYHKTVAPNLCSFGDANILFEHAYAPAPATVPVFRAILSGELIANETLDEVVSFYDNARYLPGLLREQGFTTVGISDHESFGSLTEPQRVTSEIIREFDRFDNYGKGRASRTSREVTDGVIAWLEENQDLKFFLWTHLFDPHFNYNPVLEQATRFGFDESTCGRVYPGMDIDEIRSIQRDLSEPELDCIRALYDGELAATDQLVGEMLAALERLELAEKTAVIVAGDHGEEFRERSWVGHEATVYDELIHVPLMMRNPSHPMRERRTIPVSTVAIYDVIRRIAEPGYVPRALPVISRGFHYYRIDAVGLTSRFRSRPNEFSLVFGKRKLIHTPKSGRWELYDLASDPGERSDLWSEGSPELEMQQQLLKWLGDHHPNPPLPSREAKETFHEMQERLRALGYL